MAHNAHSYAPPQFVVRLCSGNGQQVWTGATISEAGEILTTSQALGESPIADIELADGTRGQACVTGRDDDIGLALLKPFLAPRVYDFADLSSTAPTEGDQLGLLQHSEFSDSLDTRVTTVAEYETAVTGYDFFRIRAADNTTADGAVLLNKRDEIQGIRMPPLWLLAYEISNSGEVWAVDAPAIASVALPILRSGRMYIMPWWPQGGPYPHYSPPPPSELVVFHGRVTLDGKDAPAGSIFHARVSKEGLPDIWSHDPLPDDGLYAATVSAFSSNYEGATVEFWMDCRRSPMTATLDHPRGSAVELDLAF